MKKNKNLQKVINRLVDVSINEGKLIESQITRSITALKSLPATQAIEALSEYLKELRFRERQHTMYIETVIPLSNLQIQKIKKIAEKRVKITKVVTQINLEILGGFKLRIGDDIWDESIMGKVTQIKEVITNG